MPVLVGVIGGIGPSATIKLMQYVLDENQVMFLAKNSSQDCIATIEMKDSDHVPLLVYNNTQIPNNNLAVCGTGPPSLPASARRRR